ncbi:hypothetical protein PWT90_04556 [Aphanocladium album]|nr:hypothetical protein PWT90_04556 [Aphanocladium album]
MQPTLSRLLTAVAALPVAQAVLVPKHSPCETKCGNVLESTSQSDIACDDNSFGAGDSQIFKGCVECEINSHFVGDNNQTDVTAGLYNMRYALSSCLFGVPSKENIMASNPCVTSKACENFMNATIFDKLSSNDRAYEYCDIWPVHNEIDFAGCRDCLAADHHVLSNFVTMLHAGCKQRPEQGVTVGVSGDPFAKTPITITSPSPIATVDPAWFDHGPLDLSAKVGIAVGGFVFILIILGIFIVWNGKRRRRAFLRKLDIKTANRGWPSPQARIQIPTGEMFETPVSQRPLNGGWGDSPLTPSNDKPFPRYISPYSSQCNSPITGNAPDMAWPSAALSPVHNIGIALGPTTSNDSYGWENGYSNGKGKAHHVESFELHDVDSSVSDNSNCRRQQQYSQDYGLTESDAKRGNAF